RMIVIAAVWIAALLGLGGLALERVLSETLTASFDEQLANNLNAMINVAELDEMGEVKLLRPLGDQRFAEPYSGLYWQISGGGRLPFPSRSLWDRELVPLPATADCRRPCALASRQFAGEPLRVIGRRVRLPGSAVAFEFQVAQSSRDLDAQLQRTRAILVRSLSLLGLGLIAMAALQSTYGLAPLKRVSDAIAAIRSGRARRVGAQFPVEVAPLVTEINELLDQAEAQAEAARRHAGNLAHALKTPMSILVGEARGRDDPLARAVEAQVQVMRRHVDHQLARARAAGRRGSSAGTTPVRPVVEAIARTVTRLHGDRVTIDIAGSRDAAFRGDRQDLEEMVGNLVENAAVHGGGRVFVTIEADEASVTVMVEDDGPGITPAQRQLLFQRGERLDTDKPGTGLGLAIVKDVAELCGGAITLEDSEDLGGLMAVLSLPRAPA
ncbi:MAG: HAMP domain-containing histidine kinase, partial [Sandarakinorhabdus sp.]|nr:HAMP domain-containing histidine kinase [Sandarakinorhabdus sp.]